MNGRFGRVDYGPFSMKIWTFTAQLVPGPLASAWLSGSILALGMPVAALAQTAALPAPSQTPLKIDPNQDPILELGRTVGSGEDFKRLVSAAVDRHPAIAEAEAQIAQGRAVRAETRAGLYPTADATITSYKVIDRSFGSAGLTNVVERTRPTSQTDALLSVNQLAFDGGATFRRVSAANARIRAASDGVDDVSTKVALNTIGAWYDVYTFRMLVVLTEQFRKDQLKRREDLLDRISQGVSAEADVARLDSAVASIDTRLATYRRQLANAEAQFQELTGTPAPASIYRSPALGTGPASLDEARNAADDVPAVRAAVEQARAARYERRAAKADAFPVVGVSIDSGRYGVFETDRDYDIRARVTARMRLGGAGIAREDQAVARETAAQARAATVREEAARDAAIAFSDVNALEDQLRALQSSYIASRQSRDTIAERFRVTRGALTDVLDVNDSYFSAAATYVNTLADRDAAHYVLLARTGRLLDALGIEPAKQAFRIK